MREIEAWIMSSGRAGKVKTLRLFPQSTIFVWRDELSDYEKAYPDNIVISLGSRVTLARKRNLMLDAARAKGAVVLFLDDDVTRLYARLFDGDEYDRDATGAHVRCAVREDLEDDVVVTVVGHMKNYAKRRKARNVRSGIVRQAYSIDAAALPSEIRFDEDFDLLCDLDFTMQLLAAGARYCTRYDVALNAHFRGYEDRTDDEIGRLRQKWGEGRLVVRRRDDGSLRSVSPAYKAFVRPEPGLLGLVGEEMKT